MALTIAEKFMEMEKELAELKQQAYSLLQKVSPADYTLLQQKNKFSSIGQENKND